MRFASRLLSSARVVARTTRGSTGLSSPLVYRTPVAICTPRIAGYATETPAESVKKAEFQVASEIPPPSGIAAQINDEKTDWSKSYHGLSEQAFSKEVADVLMAPVEPLDIEMKPDGMIYLPEIKYRRILNKAFGPGGWGLAPRTETNVGPKVVSREYALVCQGRLVAIARGEQEYFDPSGVPTATESCKSNALMRCCKDLGIASELWDPRFIREFKSKYCVEVFAEHLPTKKKKKLWRRKDQPKLSYPYQES
ncbi:mitochondrial genome maintenance MGM101-domain-containing protein [Lentinula detonsa]|uniref:Mitochondrial genome maintenance protein MGM101 n=1 Tax=Lentinula detonsa TaxID=2804962 RepID=A0A9W8TUC3_9AGAR|nr:mitochondrial genome maintenance MGM101-domain-containing protein [Lentinula detonsa]KAJ3983051.1 mitochondrial genome maintenance MGM101-domain-containing protein [Lentinula detonsa]